MSTKHKADPPGTQRLDVSMDPHELEEAAKADRRFVTGHETKVDRELWVGKQWLCARGVAEHSVAGRVLPGGDPPDLLVDGLGVEVVMVLDDRRRPGDEYNLKVELATRGQTLVRHMHRATVRDDGHNWIVQKIMKKATHYGSQTSTEWTLLVYVNFLLADAVQYELVERALATSPPPFAAVEVLYSVSGGHVARRLFTKTQP
jgi:hypothetical protein